MSISISSGRTAHFVAKEWDQPTRTVDGKLYPFAPYPEEWLLERWLPLARTLEVIREQLGGRVIHVTSGYRPPAFNKALPGTATKSQHMEGRAADIVVEGLKASTVHDEILRMYEAGLISQLGGLGRYPTFTHVDIRPAKWKSVVGPSGPLSIKYLATWTGARKDS